MQCIKYVQLYLLLQILMYYYFKALEFFPLQVQVSNKQIIKKDKQLLFLS